ncbi:hypothetical protein RvY_13111 [Ramazzottius varieornatus]|uniref:dihydrofolate reductase n=1 Tax=Ramazzottius varieornatus TaxID=947166 RepID=A0A1D1VP06_RAMVA|nr:hypothetical protein RvY_13111 [Ramazzottius varieornatus]
MSNIRKFNVIVAACENGGIGYKDALPWTLKGDMKQFAQLTTETSDPQKKNAVVMGRKTWFAIPENHRPLKNRINVVISTTLSELKPPCYVVGSVEDALVLLSSSPLLEQVEKVWMIGGERVYSYAMESPQLDRVYFTRIYGHFECDAFFPVAKLDKLEAVKDPRVSETDQEENGIKYKYEVLQSPKSELVNAA